MKQGTGEYSVRKKRQTRRRRIVTGLACVVVFCTVYALILPAITMEQTAWCGIEEHQHGDSCYEIQLVCGYDELSNGGHIHTDDCYDEEQVLICNQEESAGHVHDESCIETEQQLVCSEEHEHTTDCYETVVSYICGLTESEGAHIHEADCFETQRVLICDIPEGESSESAGQEAHVHTDDCYEKVLICQLEEHEHSLACYSNPEADLESADLWKRSVSGVELTGIWADDIVSIAQTQLGCEESTQNYIVTEDGEMKGITRYGQWYGDAYGDWCAMFVSFCLNYAEIPDTAFPYESSCERWIEQLSRPEWDCYLYANTYTPVKGDIIFFDMNQDTISDHVGIVARVPDEAGETLELTVIEGNSSNRVQYVSYETDDPRIVGFGKLPANPEQAETGEPEQEPSFSMTAAADNGVLVHLSGPKSSLPFPAEEISVTVEVIVNETAAALVDAAVADTELQNGQLYLLDVRLWHDDEEIEPVGPVVLTFEGVASPGENDIAGVFHVDEEKEQATDMNAELTEDGSVVVDTDHFSLYAIMVASEAGGTFSIDWTFSATWDDTNSTVASVSFTASNSSQDNVFYRVEYSDDGGETWKTAVSVPNKVSKNIPVSMESANLFSDAPIDRICRVYGGNSNNTKYGYTASVSLYDILDSVKTGFSDWLENSYVQDFGGTMLPTTTEELCQAFAAYYALPALTIETRMDGNTMYVDATTDGTGTYTYQWEYQDENGKWLPLCEDTTASINASEIDLLLNGGADVRCKLYDGEQIKTTSNILFVNPLREVYDAAIAEINSGLALGTLAINGTQFTNYFYYGNVARDSRVPFYDAQSYADYLARTYLDNGGGEAGLAAVKSEWDKYLYDIYDPTSKSNTVDYPKYTYGDTDLEWPKDSTSSFHGTLSPVIDPLNYNFLEGGVDYSNFVSDLEKTATAVAPGDENTDRKYDIDITADAQAKARGPVAMILQIQTSWQMFDIKHANALKGEGYTQVGALAKNTELATLYDIKQALLRFVDYMETYYPGNNLVLGITEVQHAGSQTMFSTDSKKESLYVTNNYDILRESIRNWDSFGNCEHVHYDTNALVNATRNLSSNLANWKDFYGEIIQYNDIQKVAVIIGGPTENTNSTNGYGCTLPWATFQSAGLNSVYSIRTNRGTPTNSAGVLSWLDNTANNTGAAFNDGTGTTFTEKYVATTEDAVFNYLVQIAEKEMQKKGIDVAAEDKYVDDLVVSDTISDELFLLDESEPIIARIYDKDGNLESEQTIALTDPNLSIVRNEADGTTTVTYNFGRVYNTKKCSLHFGIQAKEDYIGSNNVYSNVGTPIASYSHEKVDSSGSGTGVIDHYSVQSFDTPEVNVPIRFDATDGGEVTILVGETVDLAELSPAIVENAESLIENYDQINGTLSYVWVLPDGTEADAGSVTVTNGSIAGQKLPSRSYTFEGTEEGRYVCTLKVTFTPTPVDTSSKNFSDAVTAVAVGALTKEGNVWINVVDSSSTQRFFVRKVWVGDPPEGTDSITFRVMANGTAVLDGDGNQLEYTLSAANNWETEVTGLPAVKDGVIQNYSVEELTRPGGYLDTYSADSLTEEVWAAKVILSFTPSGKIGNKALTISCRYNGQVYTYQTPKQDYEKNVTYSFVVDNLPLDENGVPYSCEFASLVKTDDGKSVETTSPSAIAEKYLRGTTVVEVKVITNTPAYELPSTGGTGTIPYVLGGLLLILSAGTLLTYRELRRRKEDFTSS